MENDLKNISDKIQKATDIHEELHEFVRDFPEQMCQTKRKFINHLHDSKSHLEHAQEKFKNSDFKIKMKRGKCNFEFDEVSGLTHYYISNDSINSEESLEGNDQVVPIIIEEINDLKSKYHEFDFACEFLPETLKILKKKFGFSWKIRIVGFFIFNT